ncbi:MAG: DNA mismatch repair protein MutS [Bacillota bacterium]|nr:DNA mismatch repair protein MutS [Bacillota bacterium]
MKTAYDAYFKRKSKYNDLIDKKAKAINLISNLRLAVFLIGLAAGLILYLSHNYIFLSAVILVFIVAFIYLIVKHNDLIKYKKYYSFLRDINENSLKRLEGQWNDFNDKGEEFKDPEHRYYQDLDMFGQNSLFHWINTAKTYIGRNFLRELFGNIPQDVQEILDRQEAINELSSKLTWRQRLQAETMEASGKIKNPEELIKWSADYGEFFLKKWVVLAVRVVPVFTGIIILLSFYSKMVPFYIPLLLLFMQFLILRIGIGKRHELFLLAERYSSDIKVYYRTIKHLERHKFKTSYIRQIKDGMTNKEGLMAYKQLDRLAGIVDNIAVRHSAFFEVLNILTLWDFQNMAALEKWRYTSGKFLGSWLEAVGRIEALSSLAVIRFDHPDWAIPSIKSDVKPFIECLELGHPLLKDNGIRNNIQIIPPIKVLLITGSNMSGKSTLLRTIGVNLVLAYTGAPVCAKSFSASLMDIYTCMRVSDNLGKNISSFYAELIRIKDIVKRAETGDNVFFLLDEIFKGTNSKDRHMGARVLIKRLSELNCVGLVSTHDLELGELEKEETRVKNYHFREYYEDDKIRFDYKLRQGVSTTRNAVYLMRLAGIEIKE